MFLSAMVFIFLSAVFSFIMFLVEGSLCSLDSLGSLGSTVIFFNVDSFFVLYHQYHLAVLIVEYNSLGSQGHE